MSRVFSHGSLEGRTGYRWWLHLWNSCFHIEFYWWAHFCHASVEVDDEGWSFAMALPPLALFVSLEGFGLWKPQKQCIATWDHDRVFWLTDQREAKIAIHNWTIWLTPWGKWGEWVSADPWWVRGVSFDMKRFVIGKTDYACEQTGPSLTVQIPMPEGSYSAVFTPQRQTWKPRRWFPTVRESFDIKIPKGIPFAGKGENSWDCGDDGLFGMGAEGSVQDAIAKVRETVMERRRRYGRPSEQAIAEALA